MPPTNRKLKKGKKPTAYVIAGPNGAGKTTFAMRYLPRIVACRNFLNADLIAQGLSPLDMKASEIQAGRIFLRRIREQVSRRVDFAFETTLSGRGYVKLFHKLINAGFSIVLFYLWIPSAGFSAQRVASRVKAGGHDIPQEAILRRYLKSIRNLFKLYSTLTDRMIIFDNSGETPELIMDRDREAERVLNPIVYKKIQKQIWGKS